MNVALHLGMMLFDSAVPIELCFELALHFAIECGTDLTVTISVNIL